MSQGPKLPVGAAAACVAGGIATLPFVGVLPLVCVVAACVTSAMLLKSLAR